MTTREDLKTKYNFSPLQSKVSFREMISDTKDRFASGSAFPSMSVVTGFKSALVLYAVTLAAEFVMITKGIERGNFFAAMLLLPSVFLMFALSTTYHWIIDTRQRVRLNAFAIKNNFAYLGSTSTDYNGLIFQYGGASTPKTMLTAIQSTSGMVYEFGNYYRAATGIYTRSTRDHYYGFVRFKLPGRLPPMVLDATANNTFKYISNLPGWFGGDQKLSLEGDFDKYFMLYAPAIYKTDALALFTPDIMRLLISDAHTFDAEVVDDNLYLYTDDSFDLSKPETLLSLIELADALSKALPPSEYYTNEQVGDRAANTVASADSHYPRSFGK
jgi:hypothetical protein